MFSVGFGWYIYVYVSRADYLRWTTYGISTVVAIVTALLTRSAVTAIVAGFIAIYIGNYIFSHSAPPVGYCKELKFTYVGNIVGVKNVKRSC